jgi:hypothetical protein
VGKGREDSDEAFPLWLDVPHPLHFHFYLLIYFPLQSESLSVEQVGFGLDLRMGVMQRSLGSMTVGVSPLRAPFVAALVALCLIWSILSLDMSRVRSTVVCSIMSC